MKQVLVMALVVVGFLTANAQDSSDKPSVAAPSTGVDAGKPSKEQRKAMHEALKDEKSAVDSACVEEAKAANCGDKIVGKGLLKCIHEHKKASKEFKVSDGCKSAMKNLRAEKEKLRK
tara:strand:- start:12810 stop:13163 length:354 start_codon:yes stop_codon:yes gene_type:complete